MIHKDETGDPYEGLRSADLQQPLGRSPWAAEADLRPAEGRGDDMIWHLMF